MVDLLLSLANMQDTLPAGNLLAYLDPGSGAMIIQMIIASVVGAGVALKLFWGNIISFFTGKKSEEENNQDSE